VASPAPDGHANPNRLDDTKGPRALQESIDGAKCACARKRENEPRVPVLQRVEDQHQSDGQKAE